MPKRPGHRSGGGVGGWLRARALDDKRRAFVNGRKGDGGRAALLRRARHRRPASSTARRSTGAQPMRPSQVYGGGASHQTNTPASFAASWSQGSPRPDRPPGAAPSRSRLGVGTESEPTRSRLGVGSDSAPSRRAAVPGGGWGLPLLGGRRGAGACGGGSSGVVNRLGVKQVWTGRPVRLRVAGLRLDPRLVGARSNTSRPSRGISPSARRPPLGPLKRPCQAAGGPYSPSAAAAAGASPDCSDRGPNRSRPRRAPPPRFPQAPARLGGGGGGPAEAGHYRPILDPTWSDPAWPDPAQTRAGGAGAYGLHGHIRSEERSEWAHVAEGLAIS